MRFCLCIFQVIESIDYKCIKKDLEKIKIKNYLFINKAKEYKLSGFKSFFWYISLKSLKEIILNNNKKVGQKGREKLHVVFYSILNKHFQGFCFLLLIHALCVFKISLHV